MSNITNLLVSFFRLPSLFKTTDKIYLNILLVSSLLLISYPLQAQVTFQIQWSAPGHSETLTYLPMHEVKVILTGKNNQVLGTSYFQHGSVSFPFSPMEINQVILQARFQDHFTLFDAHDAPSCEEADTVYQQTLALEEFTAEADNIYTYRFATQHESGVWSVFHGLADLLLQARALGIDMAPERKVLFATDQTAITPQCLTVQVAHQYDWDVIARLWAQWVAEEHQLFDEQATEALKQGFAIWFAVAIQQKSIYKGEILNVGDKIYEDSDNSISQSLETNATECEQDTDAWVIARLLWDLYDAANTQGSADRYQCSQGFDRTTLNWHGIWDILNQAQLTDINDFWKKGFLIQNNIDYFLKLNTAARQKTFRQALNAAYSFAEWGIGPFLSQPLNKSALDLDVDQAFLFKWQLPKADSNSHLVIYSEDFNDIILEKPQITASEYALTAEDLQLIRDRVAEQQASIVAVVIADDYLSNPIEVFYQDYNRVAAIVVDSSGSNQSTDPENIRIPAGQKALQCLLVSQADQSNQRETAACPDKQLNQPFEVLDLAATIDFDSESSILSSLNNPDDIIASLASIDSVGGTNIAAGIAAATDTLTDEQTINNPYMGGHYLLGGYPENSVETEENVATTLVNILQNFENRMGIILFTDGFNNAGPDPVCQAINQAICHDIRVHYGFLQPLTYNAPAGFGYTHNELSCQFQDCSQNNRQVNSTVEAMVLASGGSFGIIGDAQSQLGFVDQVGAKGLTNRDSHDPGGQFLAQQIQTFDKIDTPLQTRAFTFSGRAYERVHIIVEADFKLVLTLFDRNGTIITTAESDNRDIIDLPLIRLPFSGDYIIELFSADGQTGLLSLLINSEKIERLPQKPKNQISIRVEGSGSGSIISEPYGINCGNRAPSNCPTHKTDFLYSCLPAGNTTCVAEFDRNSAVELIAQADLNSAFIGFGGQNDCSDGHITLNGQRYCVAYFSALHTLTVSQAGSGMGTIHSYDHALEPTGIECGQKCSQQFAQGKTVMLKATSQEGSQFSHWVGDCSGDKAWLLVEMEAKKECMAYFE